MNKIRKFLVPVLIIIIIIFSVKSCLDYKEQKEQLVAETALIEKEINNVSKLVVTEMKYAKVFTYENTKSYGWDFFSSKKEALVISDAKAQISYDLKNLLYKIDPENKTIEITYIPKPELNIDPNLTFYRMDNGVMNKFEGRDYNKIKKDSYRQVLVIMAEKLDSWVSRTYIRNRFKGEKATLNNAIAALRTRGIILDKEGSRGMYRLQDKGFAWWIVMNKKREDRDKREQHKK